MITASRALAFMLPRCEADWLGEIQISEYSDQIEILVLLSSVGSEIRQLAHALNKKHKLTFLLPEHFAGL